MYGIQKDSTQIDPSKGIMPKPVTTLPKISADGSVAKPASYVTSDSLLTYPGTGYDGGSAPELAALTPTLTERLLYGRKSWT